MISSENLFASSSDRPQQTRLPFEKTKTSPSRPGFPHLGIHQASKRACDLGGKSGCERSLESKKRSAVARVKTVCISPLVGVGFVRIGIDCKAERLKVVVAVGFCFGGSSECCFFVA